MDTRYDGLATVTSQGFAAILATRTIRPNVNPARRCAAEGFWAATAVDELSSAAFPTAPGQE